MLGEHEVEMAKCKFQVESVLFKTFVWKVFNFFGEQKNVEKNKCQWWIINIVYIVTLLCYALQH